LTQFAFSRVKSAQRRTAAPAPPETAKYAAAQTGVFPLIASSALPFRFSDSIAQKVRRAKPPFYSSKFGNLIKFSVDFTILP
jgi:hypothetical protein